MTAEIEDLMARVDLGDRQAFKLLHTRVAGQLMAVAMRILKDRSAAEDVVQEVFIGLWNKASHLAAPVRKGLAWLCVVTRNRAIDTLRRRPSEVPRQAVLLAYCEGLTHVELASRLQRPLGTIKAWTRRNLMQLKTCMGAAA